MHGERNQIRLRRISFTARFLLALALGSPAQLWAADEQALEYRVKAVFLLNFTKFSEWPPAAFADSQSAMEICILGRDQFGRVLDDIVQGETVNGHQLAVRRISQPPSPKTCQVLFVDPEFADIRKVIAELPAGILTVSEGDRFTREGGMIALVVDNRRVRFDINLAAAEKGALKLSSKLLSVARSTGK